RDFHVTGVQTCALPIFLDEPTTYLDIAHQQEILSLLRRLNRTEGRTIVMVLHDVNAAAQVSDHVVAMRDGGIVAEGPPERVLTQIGRASCRERHSSSVT